ncbi:MAG: sigma-70 family RNA polymerase sigma factor [Gemmatimonadaceae bacterium]|nr:sigma-70 family RNA polymerase sigma factor [Gemmatimonadaceae bacterium]
MDSLGQHSITSLLQAVERGERDALNDLLPLVYEELHRLAHHQRREWQGDLTLNTTAIVHEAYLKLVDQKKVPAESRTHFFAVAAKAMRHILCNYARDRRRQKRGGDAPHLSLGPDHDLAVQIAITDEHAETLDALDAALKRLERIGQRQASVVECRFFGGLSVEDTAAALGISERTAKRDWTFARAWLRREMVRSDLST